MTAAPKVDTYTRVRASLCPYSALTELELDQHACRITEDVALAKLSPRHPVEPVRAVKVAA